MVTKGMKATSAMWITIGSALLVAFLSFSAYRFYIYNPGCYATKVEVREARDAARTDLKEFKFDVMSALTRMEGKQDSLTATIMKLHTGDK